MSSVSMPRDLSEEAVAEWLWRIFSEDVHPGFVSPWDEQVGWRRTSHERTARAVRALLEAKVREAVRYCVDDDETDAYVASIVSRVLGDHPSNASGGHEAEGREVPRG